MKLSSYNQTAYRIIQILRWLSESPQSLEEINQRFVLDPHIQRSVSQDSVGLYINTLKALGCDISRPSLKNGYRYNLASHPFSYCLNEMMIETLQKLYLSFSGSLDYRDMAQFNRLIVRFFDHAVNEDREALKMGFFERTRTVPVSQFDSLLDELEQHIQAGQLLKILYHSPVRSREAFEVLPFSLLQNEGIFYLLCYGNQWDNSGMLRLERIESIMVLDDKPLLDALQARRMRNEIILLRLFECQPEYFEPFTQHDEFMPDPLSDKNLLVKVPAENLFLLKQKLLSADYAFQVLSPPAFRQELQRDLDMAINQYQTQ